MSKILTVFGATGQQGGGLIAYLLKHPTLSKMYKLRGITRDSSKPGAVALKEKGVELVIANMDDRASLTEAVAGSYAVFASGKRHLLPLKYPRVRPLPTLLFAAGADWLIWCSLPNVTTMTKGRLSHVEHFDSKAEVETYVRSLPIKSSFFMAAFYMQNFETVFKPRINTKGVLEMAQTWSLETQTPLIDITDTGKFVAPALLNPIEYDGKVFTLAAAIYTPKQLIETWKEVTGKDVRFTQIPVGTARGSAITPEMARVLQESAGLISEFSYFGPTGEKDLEWTLSQIDDVLNSWETFVRANGPWFEDV